MVMLTNDGLEYQAKRVNHVDTGYWGWIAIGEGTTAEGATLTALTTEITDRGGARSAATCTYEATAKSVWTKTWTFSGSCSVNEVGIFDSLTPAGSKMLLRHKFTSTKSVVNTDTLQITIKLTQSA